MCYVENAEQGSPCFALDSEQCSKREAHTHKGKTSKPELHTKIDGHTVLEGCVLVTDVAVYQCRPR